MMLRRTKVMQTMAQEKPGLFRAVKEWMKNWVKTVREAFQGVSEVHEEARAVAQMEMDRLEKFTEMWDRGLIEATENAQKSPAKEGGTVKYSFDEYSDRQKSNWVNSKRIVIYENEQQLREFIREALNTSINNKKMYFGKISNALANRIMNAVRIDVEGYNCSLSAYEIKKIQKDHGSEETEKPRGQRPVTEDDYVLVPTVILEADSITLSDKLYNGRPVINFIKTVDDSRITVSAYVSDKHLDLAVQTMFAGKKKGNLSTPMGEQAPINTPEANSGTVSTISILPSAGKSNTKFQEREELPDDRALLMAAKAQGKNAEALTTYQKKVKSLEALERKLQRQQEALEEARKEGRIATPVTRSLARNDNEGAKSSEGARPMTASEKVQALEEGIRKTQASIRIHIDNRARCKMRNRCDKPGCIVGEGLVPSRIAKKCSANSYNLRIRRTFSYTPCCREGASPSLRW